MYNNNNNTMAAELQKKLQTELEKFQSIQKDYQKYIKGKQQLDGQLSENTLVKEELDRVDTSGNVYKMIGPVLIKQDVEEARQTVQKRIDYISGETKRHDTTIKDLEKKQDSSRELLQKLQAQYQQSQQKTAIKS